MKTIVYTGVPKKAYGLLPSKEDFVEEGGRFNKDAYLDACKDMEKFVPITQNDKDGPIKVFSLWKHGRPVLELPFGKPVQCWDDNVADIACSQTWYKDPEGLKDAFFSEDQKVRRKAIAWVPTEYRFVFELSEVTDPAVYAALAEQRVEGEKAKFAEAVATIEAHEAVDEAAKMLKDDALKKIAEMKLDPETQIALNEARAKRFASFAVVDERIARKSDAVLKVNDAVFSGKAEAPRPVTFERDKTAKPVKADHVPPPPKDGGLLFNERLEVHE